MTFNKRAILAIGVISFTKAICHASFIGRNGVRAPSRSRCHRHSTDLHRTRHPTPVDVATTSTTLRSSPKPIDGNSWPDKFPAKNHCSRCGLCETSFVSKVTSACAFLGDGMKRNVDGMEESVHGRVRDLGDVAWDGVDGGDTADEARFGVMHTPMTLARGKKVAGAQWTGCVTGIAASMLESGMVDAVVCIANGDGDGDAGGGWSQPEPILARTVDDVMRGRGVKPSLAPSLRVLDEIKESEDIKRLLFCGVGCAVQAFRAIQNDLDLDEVYVLGTNCADNSPTPEAARDFIRQSIPMKEDSKILGYEFMQDFRVHVKVAESGSEAPSYQKMPYFCLPGSVSEFAIADSCLACFDYTNALADVVVGYMAAPLEPNKRMDESYQTLTIRNRRGGDMVQAALNAERLDIGPVATGRGSHEKFASVTTASDNIVSAMIGEPMKEQGMPKIMGEVMASIMTNIGPKGVNFARYSIDYHTLRNYLHVLDEWGEKKAKRMIPANAATIVNHYLATDEKFKATADAIKSKR